MRDWFLEEVRKTIEARLAGQEARIVLKMNSLVDARSIRALYVASQAGVQVDLNIRGICCLRPGVPEVSDNIRVVSVVGRFLEHSRIYGFVRGDERRYWIGSADLMPRNLDTRVELLAPVEDPALRADLEDTLDRCLADDTFAWELEPDGAWRRRQGRTRSVHRELMERAAGRRPSTDLRAITRAADSRTRARKAGERRARASRRGKTSFQLADPVIRIRSAPARDRALRRGGDARARQHRGRLEAVGDRHAVEAERAPEQVGGHHRRLRRDPLCVERRVERMREHHERHVRVDRRRERDQLAVREQRRARRRS